MSAKIIINNTLQKNITKSIVSTTPFLEKIQKNIIYVVIPLFIANYYWRLITHNYIDNNDKSHISNINKHIFVSGPLSGITRFAMTIIIPLIFNQQLNLFTAQIKSIVSYIENTSFGILYSYLEPVHLGVNSINNFYLLYLISSTCVIIGCLIFGLITNKLNKAFLIMILLTGFRVFIETITKHNILKYIKSFNIYVDALIFASISAISYLLITILTFWI
jgi:hypothetical protein